MNEFDIKRLALVLAIQAEIEAMKIHNQKHPDTVGYDESHFWDKANELRELVYKHNEQL